MLFNFVFGDDQGNIAHRATGAVPIRKGADGGFPRVPAADGSDDWTGWIPKDRMPGMTNPARGWVGTANHDETTIEFADKTYDRSFVQRIDGMKRPVFLSWWLRDPH